MEKFKVTFLPENKQVEAAKDTTILSAALSAGVYINSACGGDGVCGRCKVIVRQGSVAGLSTASLTPEEKNAGIYLACVTTVLSDCIVEVPQQSRLDLDRLTPDEIDQRLKGFYSRPEDVELVGPELKGRPAGDTALTQKIYLELSKPTLQDTASDLERLYRALLTEKGMRVAHAPLVNIRLLSEVLRSCDWKVTVTLGRREAGFELLEVEPGDTSAQHFGLAFDIGTTTISGQLVDMNSGLVLGTKAVYNKQAQFGADVITRIIHAQKKDGLEQLHGAVCESINTIIDELCAGQAISRQAVSAIVCAGNTTMTHLLLRIDPSHIRRSPYIATANFLPVMRPQEAGIHINPRGLLFCLPGIASYVGGDITSGVLSCALESYDDLCLLIDIGTNGEIVLGSKEFLIASAASAGPAFEGSGVASGMRSARGAIQKVHIGKDGNCTYDTIGNARPRGICGSGYIDLLAQLLKAGLLDKNGRFKDTLPHERLRTTEEGKGYVVAFQKDCDADSDIVITEADIDNLKRAKAAIYSAAVSLANHVAVDLSNVKRIFIAGGFGSSLNIENAVDIGLLPDMPRELFTYVGNSSLAGSRMALMSGRSLGMAEEIARKMTYCELSTEAGYMDEYTAALFFPHTDAKRFGTVRY